MAVFGKTAKEALVPVSATPAVQATAAALEEVKGRVKTAADRSQAFPREMITLRALVARDGEEDLDDAVLAAEVAHLAAQRARGQEIEAARESERRALLRELDEALEAARGVWRRIAAHDAETARLLETEHSSHAALAPPFPFIAPDTALAPSELSNWRRELRRIGWLQ